jgi:glycosyltransferase involved in cell wall biosynthesis
MAPRPSYKAIAKLPIIVVGALRTASGLGESARLCHDALKAGGLPVFGIDLTAALMQPDDYTSFAFADGHALQGAGTLILHVNSPLVPLAMLRLGRRLIRDKRIVGCWAWELPNVPNDWRVGVPFVHEIWAPSKFTADAIRPVAEGRAVHALPYPAALYGPPHAPDRESADQPFTVLTIFNMASSFDRKNPLASIAAFRRAFGNDSTARLIVKTSNLSAFPQGLRLIKEATCSANNIIVIDNIVSASDVVDLYLKADVVLSLHRSEGFGLLIAEAMSHGVAVVATNWSGNVDFLTPETGIPISYRLIPAEDRQGTYHYPNLMWADADIVESAQALRRLREDRALRLQLGKNGAEFAARTWTAAAYVETVRGYLGL